jgi:hypothetical protein
MKDRSMILRFSKIMGKNKKFKTPNQVLRQLRDQKDRLNVPFSNKQIAMISFLTIKFIEGEDIDVLFNYIENDLFMIQFDVITEAETDIDCDSCGGSGTHECSICDGTGDGDEDDDGYVDDCSNCEGTGQESCMSCDGNGYYIDDNSVLKDISICFSYNKDYFNKFELNTSGFIESWEYDEFLEDDKTIFYLEDFNVLDKYNYQFDAEEGQSFIVDLIKL